MFDSGTENLFDSMIGPSNSLPYSTDDNTGGGVSMPRDVMSRGSSMNGPESPVYPVYGNRFESFANSPVMSREIDYEAMSQKLMETQSNLAYYIDQAETFRKHYNNTKEELQKSQIGLSEISEHQTRIQSLEDHLKEAHARFSLAEGQWREEKRTLEADSAIDKLTISNLNSQIEALKKVQEMNRGLPSSEETLKNRENSDKLIEENTSLKKQLKDLESEWEDKREGYLEQISDLEDSRNLLQEKLEKLEQEKENPVSRTEFLSEVVRIRAEVEMKSKLRLDEIEKNIAGLKNILKKGVTAHEEMTEKLKSEIQTLKKRVRESEIMRRVSLISLPTPTNSIDEIKKAFREVLGERKDKQAKVEDPSKSEDYDALKRKLEEEVKIREEIQKVHEEEMGELLDEIEEEKSRSERLLDEVQDLKEKLESINRDIEQQGQNASSSVQVQLKALLKRLEDPKKFYEGIHQITQTIRGDQEAEEQKPVLSEDLARFVLEFAHAQNLDDDDEDRPKSVTRLDANVSQDIVPE